MAYGLGKTLTGEAGEMGDASGGMYLDLSNILKVCKIL